VSIPQLSIGDIRRVRIASSGEIDVELSGFSGEGKMSYTSPAVERTLTGPVTWTVGKGANSGEIDEHDWGHPLFRGTPSQTLTFQVKNVHSADVEFQISIMCDIHATGQIRSVVE
jgi:hypothetical protein